ncbi:MAG: PAS domain S-box protein [Halopenitus sp.]
MSRESSDVGNPAADSKEVVLDRISDGFYALDEQFRFTYLNDRAEELLQAPQEELLGEKLWDVFPEAADIDEVWDAFHDAMETQEQAEYELYYEPLDFWVEATVYPSDTGVSVYFRDITERKEQERELAESKRQYQALVENFPNGAVALVDADLTYQTVGGTPVDHELDTAENIEGKPVDEVISPELEAVLKPRYEAALDGERSEIEVDHAGRHSRIYTFPVTDDDGEVFAAMGMSQDITDLKAHERELEQYQALTQAANDAIVTIDERSIVQSVNPAISDIFGYEPPELVGEPLTTLMSDDLATSYTEALERYLETGERTLDWDYIEMPGQHRDGSTVPLGISFNDVELDAETFFVGIIRDISERKEYERKLEESNERLERFAHAASHDLQEPLRMVSSYLQLLEDRYQDDLDEEAQEFIDFALDGADRMRGMIEGLLEYSRVETGGAPFQQVDLDEVLDAVLADLQLQIEESAAEVTSDPLPTVEGDESQLRQVLQNLLENAIEYSGDAAPRVHVSAARDGDEWVVRVRDEGEGIDPDKQDRIFEVFERLHTADENGGTGIGLALCERIVERHGGDIRVESEPGEWTTFEFTLPAT